MIDRNLEPLRGGVLSLCPFCFLEVEKVEMTEEEKLIKLYQKAFNDILARVNMSIDAGRFTARDKALLQDLNRIINHLEIEMTQFAYDEVPAMYTAEREKALILLNEALGTAAIAEQLTLIDERAIKEMQKLFYKGQKTAITAVKQNMNNVVKQLATKQKLTGGKTKELAKEFAKIIEGNGVFTFEDEAGRKWNLVDYGRMAIRTANTRAVNQSTINAGQELGNDLVRMSHHLSSCPLCAMYEGRVYSVSGKDKRYPSLASINNGAMITYSVLHPSCRHRFTNYIEDLNTDAENEQNRIDSNKPFVDSRSDAQKQAYDNRQRQNRLKQQYIKLKELKAVTDDKNTIKAIDSKLRVLRGKIKDTKDWKIDTVPVIKQVKKIEVVRNTSGELYTKFGEKHYDNLQKIVNESDDLEKQLWIKAEDRLQIAEAKSRKNGAYYSRLEGITVNIEKKSLKSEHSKPYQTIFHEFGHNIDWLVNGKKSEFSTDYQDGIFEKTIRKDFANKLAKYKDDMKEHFKVYEKDFDKLHELNYITKNQVGYLKESINKISDFFNSRTLIKKISEDIRYMGVEATPCLSDMVEGASGGKIYAGFGHGEKYWKKKGSLSAEAFAEMFELSITKDTKQLEAIKSFFPESYEIYKQMVKEMTDKL